MTSKPMKLHEIAALAVKTDNCRLAYKLTERLCTRHGLNWPGIVEWLEAHDVPVAEFAELVREAEG